MVLRLLFLSSDLVWRCLKMRHYFDIFWYKQRTMETSLFMSILQGNQFQVVFSQFPGARARAKVLVKVGMRIPRMPVGGKGYRDPGLKIEWSLCWLFLLEEAPKFLKNIYWRWLWNSRQMLGKLPWRWKMIPSAFQQFPLVMALRENIQRNTSLLLITGSSSWTTQIA